MGPGANAPGNLHHAFQPTQPRQLQWGRELTLPEMLIAARLRRSWFGLQWGRELTLPEMQTAPTTLLLSSQLQWGRELTLPEIIT